MIAFLENLWIHIKWARLTKTEVKYSVKKVVLITLDLAELELTFLLTNKNKTGFFQIEAMDQA